MISIDTGSFFHCILCHVIFRDSGLMTKLRLLSGHSNLLLQVPVNKKMVTDYNSFVKADDEIWIKKINSKITRSLYTTAKQFEADVHQILKNAQKYNVHSASMCAFPGKFSHCFACWLYTRPTCSKCACFEPVQCLSIINALNCNPDKRPSRTCGTGDAVTQPTSSVPQTMCISQKWQSLT